MKSNNKFKYTPTESPIDRVEKAFFNDAPLSSTINVKTPLKTSYKTAARTASAKAAKKRPIKNHKTNSDFNSLILIPVIFVTSILIAVIGIMVLDNHIYLLPRDSATGATPQIDALQIAIFPDSVSHDLKKGRLFITLPSLSHVKIVIDSPSPLNLDKKHLLLPVYSDSGDIEAMVYLRDQSYQANTFSPISAVLAPIDPKATLIPVEIPESLYSEKVDLARISQIKVELFNPALEPATIVVDTKIPVPDK